MQQMTMAPGLSEEQVMIRDLARDFAAEKITPQAAEWDRKTFFPHDVMMEMAGLGLNGIQTPTQWGGAGADNLSTVLAVEEIAAGDGGLSTLMSIQNSVVCMPLLRFGSDAQKKRYLQPVASGSKLGCFCLTEPGAGSDAAAIAARAEKSGNRYILNGNKQFISGARHADFALIFARTDPDQGKRGLSAFIAPTDRKGFTILRDEGKMGQHSVEACQISFDDLELFPEEMLGAPGDGLRIALSNLEGGRLGIAAQAVGMARAALDYAVAYAQERRSMGKPIIEHQGVGFRLADMATRVEAARSLLHHAARLRDAGLPCLKEVAMAKLFAADMAEQVASDAIQTFGGYGYSNDYPVEKIYRDVKVCRIYEGTSDIQKLVIARRLAASDGAPRQMEG